MPDKPYGVAAHGDWQASLLQAWGGIASWGQGDKLASRGPGRGKKLLSVAGAFLKAIVALYNNSIGAGTGEGQHGSVVLSLHCFVLC